MQSSGSGTSFLDRCWTLFFDEAVQGERQRTGVGLLIAPCLSANLFEFTLVDERVTSLCLHVGEKVLTVVWIKHQFRVPIHFGVLGTGAQKCFY